MSRKNRRPLRRPTDLFAAPSPETPNRCRPGVEPLEARDVPAAGGGWTNAGLTGTYYADTNFAAAAFTRKDQRIDFDWGTTVRPGGSISPGFRDVGTDNYSVRWTGQLIPRYSETYTFAGLADDVFVLELKKATDTAWTTVVNQPAFTGSPFAGTMALTAGQAYDVRASFKEFGGGAAVRLRWSGPSTPAEVIDTLTQSGINNPDGTAAFVDLVKGARNSWEGVDGRPRPPLDANGWPTGDAGYYFQESLNQGLDVDPLMRGTVTVRFTGKADVEVKGNLNPASLTYRYDAATNTTTGSFVVGSAGWNASQILFRNSTRTGVAGGPGGITNLQLLRPSAPDAATPYPAGTVFTSQMEDAMSRYNVIRFQLVSNQQKEWGDRTLPGYFNQAGGTRTAPTYPVGWDTTSDNGWSWEYKVLLANETGRDLMLSIPPLASNDYLTKLANLLRYGSDGVNPYTAPQANPVYPPLNPNLRVYLELGNELWNWAGAFYPDYNNITQLTHAAIAANGSDFRAINYDNLPTTVNGSGEYDSIGVWRQRFIALRMTQVSDTFRSVFGDGAMPGTAADPTVRPLLEWQYDNLNGTAATPLTFLDRYFGNGDGVPHVSTPHPVSYYLWGGGGAAYYGAANGNGLTDLLPNSGFDATAVPAGYSQAPAVAGWTFAGTAGVARDAGAADDIPTPFNGTQVGYVSGTGRATATFTVPATQTSNLYGVSFKALNRKKAGATAADAENLRVYLDYGTPSQADVTARTFSQGNGYTPPDYGSIGGPWNARNVYWTESPYYYTRSFALAAGSTHTLTVVGTRTADQTAFLDDVRVTSVDAIFAGGIPGGGEAAGQPVGQNIRAMMNIEADWAAAYGLHDLAYESGWSLGGDDGGSEIQLRAKYGEGRTADAQGRFMDYFAQAGGEVNVFGTYAQWPTWSDYYAQQGLLNAGAYPIVQGVIAASNRLPDLPTNGTAVAAAGTTTVAPAASLNADWTAPAGTPRFAVNARPTTGYTLLVAAGGSYTLTASLANAAAGGVVRVLVDGRPVGTLAAPAAGDPNAFADAAALTVALAPGRHVVLLQAQANSPAGYAANVGNLKVTASPPPASPPPASPPPAPAASASFAGTDGTTQGAWQGRYGAAGYALANGPSSGAAGVGISGQLNCTWTAGTTDPRALGGPAGGLAACWYSAGAFTVAVPAAAGGAAQRVSLYLLDWDSNGARAERVDVIDSATGRVLDGQTVGGFQGGKYLTWTVTGAVQFRVTNTGSPNAVVSGVFLEPPGAATPPPAASVSYAGTDATTRGAWTGRYGSGGYALANGPSSGAAGVAAAGQANCTWAAGSTDPRSLAGAAGGLAACWYSSSGFSVSVPAAAGGAAQKVSLYLLDWDSNGTRAERVDVLDAATGAVLDSQTVTAFQGGKYLTWTVTGAVRLRVTNTGSPNAVVSGVFLDPAASGPAAALYSDDFSAAAVNPALGFAGGTWSQSGGVLSLTGTAAGDPKKAVVTGLAPRVATEVEARVRVDLWQPGDYARAGVGVGTDAATGLGYNLVFHGANTVQFLNDHVAWGNAYAFDWQPGVWYHFKLRQEADGTLRGKVWADGSAEPTAWMFTQTGWAARSGLAAVNGGSAAAPGQGAATASFDDLVVRDVTG